MLLVEEDKDEEDEDQMSGHFYYGTDHDMDNVTMTEARRNTQEALARMPPEWRGQHVTSARERRSLLGPDTFAHFNHSMDDAFNNRFASDELTSDVLIKTHDDVSKKSKRTSLEQQALYFQGSNLRNGAISPHDVGKSNYTVSIQTAGCLQWSAFSTLFNTDCC